MGNTSSSITEHDKQWAINVVKVLIQTPNIHFAKIIFACQRLFIIIGEEHEAIEIQELKLLQMMKDFCGKEVNIDLFIESGHLFRDELRYRTASVKETEKKVQEYEEMGADSLQLQRVAAEMSCDTFRVHAVDVRDRGFITYAFPNPKNGEYQSDFANRCYSITLKQNLDFVMRLTRSSIRKGIEETKQVSTKNALKLKSQIEPLENTWDFDEIWNGYSKLVDIYLLARMCRKDNSNVCFFYGGQNHAERTVQCIENLPNAKVLYSFDKSQF